VLGEPKTVVGLNVPRWRVDYLAKETILHVGTVEAPDERSAIAKAAKQFNISPARRFRLVVRRTKIEGKTTSRT
jgi:hypothetical protein